MRFNVWIRPAFICAALSLAGCAHVEQDSSILPTAATNNAFHRFVGEWTLKNDTFQQVWDGQTVETPRIPNHHTRCDVINTGQSILCVVDAGDLKGHIFWAYDERAQTLHHLSHFGETRLGTGVGVMNANGDLRNEIRFSDEPEGTYRIYEYVWVSADEYTMMSRQYDADGDPTGNWYGGAFVRLQHPEVRTSSSHQ